MIVATAGHIDHGKTRLVRALTGVDTDRLPEEKQRGISIDLGFAHADLGAASAVSFVDVPGHERFIRNMLAGVSAVDAALVVVAADDGAMPQTLEHLHILDLLDVRRGAVVITKADVVPRARVDAVAAEMEALLSGTSLEGSECFVVSSVSGVGLPALRDWLGAAAAARPARDEDGRRFRLAVDRVFTIAGSGTVVTGTVHGGRVAIGDSLVVSPAGREVRVRGVQLHGAAADGARAGQRCALNLAGVGVDEIGRGDWVLHGDVHAPATRLDARLRVLASESEPLAHWSQLQLHVGTDAVATRVAIPAEGSIAPGASGWVQLVPERPICALHGDRFVVRDQSARRTLGGGIVLDPFAPRRPRRSGLRTAELQVYELATPAAIVAGLLELAEGGVDIDGIARTLALPGEAVLALAREADAVVLGRTRPLGLARASVELTTARLLATLRDFHAAAPKTPGIEAAALRRAAAPRLPAAAFHLLLRELANRGTVLLSNDVVSLRAHDATANADDQQLWTPVRAALVAAGVQAPLLAPLAAALRVKEATLRDFLHRKSRTGELLRVTPERFALRETLARLAATAVVVGRDADDGLFSAAQFRDAIGTGRGLAIHYLELFDRLGLTQRFGDLRRTAKDFIPVLGAAEPLPALNPCKEPT